jgi:hypothetical protein
MAASCPWVFRHSVPSCSPLPFRRDTRLVRRIKPSGYLHRGMELGLGSADRRKISRHKGRLPCIPAEQRPLYLTSIDFLGAAETAPCCYTAVGGFNAGGDIASGYCAAEPCTSHSSRLHSFLLKNNQFTSFDPPRRLGATPLASTPLMKSTGPTSAGTDSIAATCGPRR